VAVRQYLTAADRNPYRDWLDALDVTSRARIQARVRLSLAPDAIIVVNRDGNMVILNTQAERLFKHAREDLLGMPVETLVPERFRRRHGDHRGGFVADPRVRPMGSGLELFGLRSDGSEFPVEISLSPIDTDEGVLVSAAIRDISDRKRVETNCARHCRRRRFCSRRSTTG
jgi:PAS domain S-box-containing protein